MLWHPDWLSSENIDELWSKIRSHRYSLQIGDVRRRWETSQTEKGRELNCDNTYVFWINISIMCSHSSFCATVTRWEISTKTYQPLQLPLHSKVREGLSKYLSVTLCALCFVSYLFFSHFNYHNQTFSNRHRCSANNHRNSIIFAHLH